MMIDPGWLVALALAGWIVRGVVRPAPPPDELRRSLVELCRKAERMLAVGENVLLVKGFASKPSVDFGGLAQALFPTVKNEQGGGS